MKTIPQSGGEAGEWPLHLSLRQLQVFVAVARQGSTVAAGERIGLSQSATSAALKELERLLGLPLFDRAGKRLLLNEAGRGLLPRARALLDGAYSLQTQAAGGAARQQLRVGASMTLGAHLLPGLLREFYGASGDAADRWQARVQVANTAAICAAVARYELDLGLIEGPCPEPGLVVQPWLDDELLVVASPVHALLRPPALDGEARREALRDAVWLLREPGAGTREAGDAWLLPLLRAYRRSITMDSPEAIKQGVIEGLGLACLSRWAVQRELDQGLMRVLDTGLAPRRRPCYWVLQRDKPQSPALREFIALLQARRAQRAPARRRAPHKP
ncbi:LysR substrate-binding domain-containing protein [Pelomonas sp. CA6]|uniref:LysR substrate-binding domain-containing protein n=1 Tax=Pelomonas sp. CA6 TaxID=2907999 RepID=UPI001F4C0488|nr:LysR substrate-binding domain-containing protein [Pelomonas sp. CA6]MCH7345661.1 LysR substrate-binding domain-containing protein [Pelomonas sp. CA6]